jgi:(2Fe-2S) ferredoxin
MKPFQKHIFICTNHRPDTDPRGSCAAKGSEAVKDRFKELLKARGIKGAMRANASGCLDQCAMGVTVVVYPETVWYGHVKLEDVEEIVDKHLIGGQPVERLRIDRPATGDKP